MAGPWENDPAAEQAAPQAAAPWAQDATVEAPPAAPAATPAPVADSGFTDEQKQAILDYVPHAKDAADLERYSSELTQGRAKIGNAQKVIEARDQGHKQFAWTAPTVDKSMAPQPTHGDIKSAIGDGIIDSLDTFFPGVANLIRGHQGAGKAFTEHAANALAADYGPEVGGFLDTITHPGSSLDNNVAHERAQLAGDSEGHGVASTAGELTGVGLSAGLGNEAGLANLGRVGKVAATAGEGALYGSGADGPGNRAEGAAIGAVAAPVIGAVAKAPVALYNAGKSVLEGTPGLARRIISSAIKQDMNTPESVGQAISEAHSNGVPMALGDTGENMRGLLAASSRASGVGRTVVRDALEERQSQLADRITGHIERDLGPVANPHQVADDLMTKARAEAAPLYDKFYDAPPVSSPAIDALVQRPSMQKALKNAYNIAKEEGRDPEALGLRVDGDGNVAVDAGGIDERLQKVADVASFPVESLKQNFAAWAARDGEPEALKLLSAKEAELGISHAAPAASKAYTPQTLDYIKRGMDDVVEGYRDPTTGKLNLDTEGRAVNNTLRSYMGTVDQLYPDYAKARATYAGPVKGIAAMNLGRKALTMTGDDLEARMRDMSPYEKTMFASGIRRAMAETVQSKGDTADIVNTLAGTGKKRAMLARAFGDRKQFQRFVDTLGQEREGWRSFKQALLGSPTAANAQDDGALQTATLAADLMTTGLPVATSMRYALKFGVGKLGEKAKQQVAALLSNTDPAAIRELAAELRTKAEQRGINVRRANAVTRSLGKGAIVAMPRQQAQ